jgi:hypothetical protein
MCCVVVNQREPRYCAEKITLTSLGLRQPLGTAKVRQHFP